MINLCTGSDRGHTLTRVGLVQAENRIRESVALMRELLLDDARNEPLEKEHFPMAHPATRCPFPGCVLRS